ncbi:MAG: hypothetical protein PHC40_03660 [Eubacteriales bacterium]|nr:hypothetical protein [Eubacteriales bacterium]
MGELIKPLCIGWVISTVFIVILFKSAGLSWAEARDLALDLSAISGMMMALLFRAYC